MFMYRFTDVHFGATSSAMQVAKFPAGFLWHSPWCSSFCNCMLQQLVGLKCPWHDIFYYLIEKSFQNGEQWRLFYCDSTLGCRVIKDFDLCKLDECDITTGTQSDAKSQKIEYLCKY